MSQSAYDGGVLPPVLEIYVVWHPDDAEGTSILDALLGHYRGTPYSGLLGGSVEVYARSVAWHDGSDAPRPLPCVKPLPYDLLAAQVTAVVPVVGPRLARAVEDERSQWRVYLEEIRAARADSPERIGIFPVRIRGSVDGELDRLLGDLQHMSSTSAEDPATLCREMSQAVAQFVNKPSGERLKVFISHTKRQPLTEDPADVDDVVSRVRSAIGSTQMQPFFDIADIQLGSGWEDELRREAASSALLAIRTDLYSGREWCQREFLIAKQSGMPIVTLNAVRGSEERGSFLMDHVPSVRYDDRSDETKRYSIEAALNMLVGEALRRAIWNAQVAALHSQGVNWAPWHAPEPSTALHWLLHNERHTDGNGRILVMHPDPPLGSSESDVMDQLFALAVGGIQIDIVTPRTYVGHTGVAL